MDGGETFEKLLHHGSNLEECLAGHFSDCTADWNNYYVEQF